MTNSGEFFPEQWKKDAQLLGVSLTDEDCKLEMEMKTWKLDFEPNSSETNEKDGGAAFDDEYNSDPNVQFDNYIKDQADGVDNNEKYQKFAKKIYDKMEEFVQNEQSTLLFNIASSIAHIDWWRIWVKLLLDIGQRLGKNLLLDQNKNTKNTCLHEAIQRYGKKSIHFILFLGTFADEKDFKNAIATPNHRGETCLHTAIAIVNGINVEKLKLVHYLMEKAGSDAFIKQRRQNNDNDAGSGNTCLHDLLDIRLCKRFERQCPKPIETCEDCRSSERLSDRYHVQYMFLVDSMASKYPKALLTWNTAHQSPFLFHKATKAAIKDTDSWIGESNGNDTQSKLKEAVKMQSPLPPKKSMYGPFPVLEDRPIAFSDRGKINEKGKTGTAKPVGKTNKANSKSNHDKAITRYSEALSNMAASKLAEHCLSQDDFGSVCISLFGEDYPRTELRFKADPLTDKTREVYKSLPLNPILTDVELHLIDTSKSQDNQMSVKPQKLGRKLREERDSREHRVKTLFKWLRENRHVQKIIKLSVYDNKQFPCRDDVIQECLRGFDIRYLEWDKDDLCVSLLAKEVAPRLKEVWLSWSGRNTALLGWANRENGLCILKDLKKVSITTYTEWENPETYRRNIASFKESLQKDNINVVDSEEADPGSDKTVQGGTKVQDVKIPNRWLDSVKLFRQAVNAKISKELQEKAHVSVAVIDTGVQLLELGSAENIKPCYYEDKKEPGRGSMNEWYVAKNSHGTDMIRLIRTVCPHAEIYVAKLDHSLIKCKCVAESAAKAIEAATKLKANVISMSWSIYDRNDNGKSQDGIKDMKKAIEDAGKSPLNTIMFCAAEDQGKWSKKNPYPATEHNSKILKRIGSASTYGGAAYYVDEGKIDYLFPGEISMGEDKISSGSSGATSLAAGLAAFILWCESLQKVTGSNVTAKTGTENMPLPNEGRPIRRSTGKLEPVSFQDHDNMYGLFEKLRNADGNRLVNVTSILEKASMADNPPKMLIQLAKQEIGKAI